MGDDSSKGLDDKVVKGPEKWFADYVKKSKAKRDKVNKIQQDMLFIDDMTQNIVINFLEDLKHEGFQIESKRMMGDIRFLTDVIKCIIMGEVGYKHPLREAVNKYIKDLEGNNDNS